MSESSGGDSTHFAGETGKESKEIFESVQLDFAQAMEIVFYAMAGAMALAFVGGAGDDAARARPSRARPTRSC